MPKDCPICGLANPQGAERCDCGYDFGTHTPAPSRAGRGARGRAASGTKLALGILTAPVLGVVLAIALSTMDAPSLHNGPTVVAYVFLAYAIVYPVSRLVRRLVRRREIGPSSAVWGWLTYAWGVCVVLLLVLPQLEGVGGRPRIAKAQADARVIASAISQYRIHCGVYPPPGAEAATCPAASGPGRGEVPLALTVRQTNAQGVVAGPFLPMRPIPPRGWLPYRYVLDSKETFDVCSSGDDTVAAVGNGNRATCP